MASGSNTRPPATALATDGGGQIIGTGVCSPAEAVGNKAERMAHGSTNYVASPTAALQSVQRSPPFFHLPSSHLHVGSTSHSSGSSASLQQQQQHGGANLYGSNCSESGSNSNFSGIAADLNNNMVRGNASGNASFGEQGWHPSASYFGNGGNGGSGGSSNLTLSHNIGSPSRNVLDTYHGSGSRLIAAASNSTVQNYGGSTSGRDKMRFAFKIGGETSSEAAGEFSEPGGIASTPLGELIIADTNNHRIQVFRANGMFKLKFGEAGRRNGQLLHPNRVAYCALTKRIIITERAPTHQVQAFSENGGFIKKFGADYLEHPRGVTVDHLGQIIIVECRIMRVVIFNSDGENLKSFKCTNLEFPNGVAVDKRERIFISDNRAHCVRVFNYSGSFLLDIGGVNITNYPIGVCVTPAGNILVGDNHNNFNITLFTPEGGLLALYESSVKHAQCLDIAMVAEGVVAVASKDFKFYVYPFGNGGIYMPPSSAGGGDVDQDVNQSLSFRAQQQQQQYQQLPLASSGAPERSPASTRQNLRMGIAGNNGTPGNRRAQSYNNFDQQ